MTREQHLLIGVMEECAEVAHRCSKALRFGLEETQEGQTLTNRERIVNEVTDLVAVLGMANLLTIDMRQAVAKQDKVERYLGYARSLGTCD